jgi:hypothetical protein
MATRAWSRAGWSRPTATLNRGFTPGKTASTRLSPRTPRRLARTPERLPDSALRKLAGRIRTPFPFLSHAEQHEEQARIRRKPKGPYPLLRNADPFFGAALSMSAFLSRTVSRFSSSCSATDIISGHRPTAFIGSPPTPSQSVVGWPLLPTSLARGRPCKTLPRTGRETNVLSSRSVDMGSLRFHGKSDTQRAIVQ